MQMENCLSSKQLRLTVPFPGGALDDMSINDLYEGSKSRKSSGFSETQSKSRNCSGMEDSKSRNCSGNSISQGLVSSGFLSSSNPVNIPGSGELTDGFGLLSNMGGAEHHGDGGGYMTGLGGSNLGFSSGLFDFGPAHAAQATSNVKDVEICRLREELGAARAKLHSWEESMGQARTACDAWKKEAAIANKKAEMAIKEREVALNKAVQLQKEVRQFKEIFEERTVPLEFSYSPAAGAAIPNPIIISFSWSSSLVVHSCMHFVVSPTCPTCPLPFSRPLTGP